MENPCRIWCALTQNQVLTIRSKSVHALFGIGWTQHLGFQGSCHKDACAIFDLLLEVVFYAKGTCAT